MIDALLSLSKRSTTETGRTPTYIVYAPDYDENSGGGIVLHQLCHTLNQLGERAFLWPMNRAYQPGSRFRRNQITAPETFRVSQSFSTPVASQKEVGRDSVVIYPEVTSGNPLAARNVVRWLLHKPGYFTGIIDYGKKDLFFKFDDYCDDTRITGGKAGRLCLFALDPRYEDRGSGTRSGSCYLVRKGKGKALVHDLNDSIQIDGLRHDEIADIFNRATTFYSYDEVTMYSQFAAICGCVSVVIPTQYKNREEWVRDHPLSRYGIAYGLDDIEHASQTRHLVSDHLKELGREGIRSVEAFVESTCSHFGFRAHG